MHLSISDDDALILHEILQAKRIDLRREIAHTDSARFRDTLRKVEEMLERVIPQLAQSSTMS